MKLNLDNVKKRCSFCKKLLPKIKFCKNKYLKDGLNHRCRKCVSSEKKKWYKRNPNYFKDHAKKWRKANPEIYKRSAAQARSIYVIKIKDRVFSYYGRKCKCCGEAEIKFLTIDHIKGGGRKHREALGIKDGFSIYSWLVKNNFPKGFRILCMNCNFASRFGRCPHKLKKK